MSRKPIGLTNSTSTTATKTRGSSQTKRTIIDLPDGSPPTKLTTCGGKRSSKDEEKEVNETISSTKSTKSARKSFLPTTNLEKKESDHKLSAENCKLKYNLRLTQAKLDYYTEEVAKLTKKWERVEVLKRDNASLKKEVAKLEDAGKIRRLQEKVEDLKVELSEESNLNSMLRKELRGKEKEVGDYFKIKDSFDQLEEQVDYIRSEKDTIHSANVNLRAQLSEMKKRWALKESKVMALEKQVDKTAVEKSKREEEKAKRAHELAMAEVKIRQETAKSTAAKETSEMKVAAKLKEKKDAEKLKTEGVILRRQHQEKVAQRKTMRDKSDRRRREETAYERLQQGKQAMYPGMLPGMMTNLPS